MIKKNIGIGFCSFCITFTLFSMLLFPIWNNKNGYETLIEEIQERQLQALGDNPGEPYHYWTAPSNSFGATSGKFVNWSYFKQLFLAHTDWILEYDTGSGWQDGNQYLTIERTWNETGYWKFNLIFENPSSQNVKARFTFACDLPVLEYVEREEHKILVNYSANATENYSCMFNWSDLTSYPNLWFNKGIQNNTFWFRFGHDNIPPGTYEFDPNFGYEGASGAGGFDIKNYMTGTPYTASSSGSVDNISAFIRNDAINKDMMFVMYKWSDKSFIGKTFEGTAIANTDQWYTLNIDGTCDVVASTEYILAAWSEDSTGDCTIGYDEETDYHLRWDSENYDASPPSTFSDDDGYTDHRATIYASYTATAPANNAPTQSGEAPDNGSTSITTTPSLYVICTDADSGDTMNATWYSNSSGSWLQFATTNTSINNNTNITQTNSNFSAEGTTYYWGVNLTDGEGGWQNTTYRFTTDVFTEDNKMQFNASCVVNKSVFNEDNKMQFNASCVVNTTEEWQNLQTWNGSIYNQSDWHNLQDYNGSIYNSSNWLNLVDWNGTIANTTPEWKNLADWNGSIYNSSLWHNLQDYNGSIYNSSIWHNLVTWNGTVANTTPEWKNLADWNGSIYNSSLWHNLQDYNGSIYNSSLWHNLQDINGTIYNTSTWHNLQDYNGSIYNSSTWHNLVDWNGSIYNQSLWHNLQDYNGSIYNSSIWHNLVTWNGTVANTTPEWKNLATWNGSIYNDSGWNNLQDYNGSIYNQSLWHNLQDYNGSIYNSSTWHNLVDWNGSIYNQSDWHNLQDYNGSIYNSSNWLNLIDYNGSIYNSSTWHNLVDWNGSIYNSTEWININNYNGTIYNSTEWYNQATWNGTIYNVSDLWTQQENWTGRIYNGTGVRVIRIRDENRGLMGAAILIGVMAILMIIYVITDRRKKERY